MLFLRVSCLVLGLLCQPTISSFDLLFVTPGKRETAITTLSTSDSFLFFIALASKYLEAQPAGKSHLQSQCSLSSLSSITNRVRIVGQRLTLVKAPQSATRPFSHTLSAPPAGGPNPSPRQFRALLLPGTGKSPFKPPTPTNADPALWLCTAPSTSTTPAPAGPSCWNLSSQEIGL